MKANNRLIEVVVRILIAGLTAYLTAITTTSCMGVGPISF